MTVAETRNKKQETRNKKQETRSSSHRKILCQVGIDLCYVESRVVEISACICVRYDAGICRHKMEHTGVLVEYE